MHEPPPDYDLVRRVKDETRRIMGPAASHDDMTEQRFRDIADVLRNYVDKVGPSMDTATVRELRRDPDMLTFADAVWNQRGIPSGSALRSAEDTHDRKREVAVLRNMLRCMRDPASQCGQYGQYEDMYIASVREAREIDGDIERDPRDPREPRLPDDGDRAGRRAFTVAGLEERLRALSESESAAGERPVVARRMRNLADGTVTLVIAAEASLRELEIHAVENPSTPSQRWSPVDSGPLDKQTMCSPWNVYSECHRVLRGRWEAHGALARFVVFLSSYDAHPTSLYTMTSGAELDLQVRRYLDANTRMRPVTLSMASAVRWIARKFDGSTNLYGGGSMVRKLGSEYDRFLARHTDGDCAKRATTVVRVYASRMLCAEREIGIEGDLLRMWGAYPDVLGRHEAP